MYYGLTLTIGITLLAIALFKFKESLDFIRKSERATATVIEVEKINDSDGATYKPIFKFKTSTNQEVIYRQHYSSSPATWEVGEEATIAYAAANPNNAVLLTYFGAFIWTIVLMAISMPLIVIGGGYYLTQQFLK